MEQPVLALTTVHNLGVKNWQADINCQWLHPGPFATGRRGQIDILASRFNNMLDRFVTRSSNPQAFTLDAQVTPWDQ